MKPLSMLFLLVLFGTACNQNTTEINTLKDVEECIKNNPSKNRQVFASIHLKAENLDWHQSICEQERLWMAVYQHEDINRGNILIRTKDANGTEETYFNFHVDDHKLATGTYSIDAKAYSSFEFDDATDKVGRVIYGGKSIQAGQLVISERSDKKMKACFTGTLPEMKLKENRDEIIYKDVKVDFSFYIHKPFKFKY